MAKVTTVTCKGCAERRERIKIAAIKTWRKIKGTKK